METIPLNFTNLARFTQEVHAVKQVEVNQSRIPVIIGAVVIGALVIWYLHQEVFIPRYLERKEA
ncbi:MAG: hypothetical protein WC865_05505 [Bacteroidales bacterium]